MLDMCGDQRSDSNTFVSSRSSTKADKVEANVARISLLHITVIIPFYPFVDSPPNIPFRSFTLLDSELSKIISPSLRQLKRLILTYCMHFLSHAFSNILNVPLLHTSTPTSTDNQPYRDFYVQLTIYLVRELQYMTLRAHSRLQCLHQMGYPSPPP